MVVNQLLLRILVLDDYGIEGHRGTIFYDATTGGTEQSSRWDASSGSVATQNPKEVTEGGNATYHYLN